MKTCPFCAEAIQDAAIVCRYCGRDLRGRTTASPNWSPGVAAVLSLVIPGAGQMYKGQVFKGLAWLLVVAIGYVAFILPGVVLHVCCIIGASLGNPEKQRQQERARQERVDRKARRLGMSAAKLVRAVRDNRPI